MHIFGKLTLACFSGRDGSREVTMSVNDDGTGGNFVNGQVTANGEAVSVLLLSP